MIELSPTENNLVKFNLSISGTKSTPSSVRFLIGDDASKIAFNAYRSPDNINEWCANIYPLSDFMFNFSSGLIYATVEIILNGRTIVPYNKPVKINSEIEKIEVKSEPISTQEPAPTPTEISPEIDRVEPIEPVKQTMDTPPVEINKPIGKTTEDKKPPLIKDVISLTKEEQKPLIKEEKKIKKQYKLKPFNSGKERKNVKEHLSIEKMIKDVVSIDDVVIKPVDIKIEKQIVRSAPFKITKKEIVYK